MDAEAAYADTAPALPPPQSTRLTPYGRWSRRTWFSACRSASSCSSRDSPARARRSTSGRGHRRHLHLRRHLLAVGLRIHVRAGDAVDRNHRLHAAWTRHLRHHRRSAAGVLGLPVCVRGHLSTVTSGAMIGRCDFIGDLLYSVGVTGFIYPIIGHWAWGPDGWLAVMAPISFHDFAGSTVVHTIGGTIRCRRNRTRTSARRVFKRDGGQPMKPHDLIIGATGGLILWFGWTDLTRAARCRPDAQGIGASRLTRRWLPALRD